VTKRGLSAGMSGRDATETTFFVTLYHGSF